MRRRIYLLIMAECLLGALLLSADDFRTWNMIGGGHFEAKLTAVGTTNVTLENKEGRTVDMALANFKPSDQDYVRTWQQMQLAADQQVVGASAVAAARSEFADKVYKRLVYAKGKRLAKFEPEPSDAPKYFAFYKSAHWCPPCRKFTPQLVDFYKKQKRAGAAFELVFISSDKNEDAMAEYMDEYDMSWPAFRFGENKMIVDTNGSGIPNLLVTDANGNKLLDSYDSSGNYKGPYKVMAELEKLLK
jgi:nucleoredoxin